MSEDGVSDVGDAVATGALLILGAFEIGAVEVGAMIGASVAGGNVGAFDPGGNTFPNETESSQTAPKITGGTEGSGSKLKRLYR